MPYPSVEVLKFEVLSIGFQDLDRQTDMVFFFPPFSGGLPRVNTRVFFFPPFSGGLPRVNTRRVFFSRPFPAGSLCMAELVSVYFKWCCPGLILGFFFPPFSGGLPRVNTRVLLLLLFFPAINRRSYSCYSI